MGSNQRAIHREPGALSPGIKRLGRETYHSSPSSVGVENYGTVPPLLSVLMTQCLIY
jgi:hypothetical protein